MSAHEGSAFQVENEDRARRENGGHAVGTLEALAAATAAAKDDRIVHWFDVPRRLAQQTGVVRVGLVELSSGEELMATRRCRNDAIRLAIELPRESLRYVNDKRINTGDLSSEEFWDSTRQGMYQIRQLVLAAYAEVHNPPADETASFLASRRMTSG